MSSKLRFYLLIIHHKVSCTCSIQFYPQVWLPALSPISLVLILPKIKLNNTLCKHCKADQFQNNQPLWTESLSVEITTEI